MRQWHLLLPDESLLHCERVAITPQGVVVSVSSVAKSAVCPRCSHVSTSIHSRYQRTLADLPWQGQQAIGIDTISRDRGDDYIRGATLGAPQAIQVADRWHLLRNLRDALVRVLDRHRTDVRLAACLTHGPPV